MSHVVGVQKTPRSSRGIVPSQQMGKKVTIEHCPMSPSCLTLVGVQKSDDEMVKRSVLAACSLYKWKGVAITTQADGAMIFVAPDQLITSMIAVLRQALCGWSIKISID